MPARNLQPAQNVQQSQETQVQLQANNGQHAQDRFVMKQKDNSQSYYVLQKDGSVEMIQGSFVVNQASHLQRPNSSGTAQGQWNGGAGSAPSNDLAATVAALQREIRRKDEEKGICDQVLKEANETIQQLRQLNTKYINMFNYLLEPQQLPVTNQSQPAGSA